MSTIGGRFNRWFSILLLLWPVVARALIGQGHTVPVIRLAPADARAGHEFSTVSALRELGTGHVLVIDRNNLELPIVLVDFEKDATSPLGRRGGGPGEFQGPLSLAPLGGDSSIITDGTLGRWLLLAGDNIVGTLGPDRMPVSTLGMVLYGGDRQGRVLAYRGFRVDRPSRLTDAFADSALLILGHIKNNTADTVARVRAAGAKMQRIRLISSDGRPRPDHLMPNPLLVPDQAVLFPDGWIAVVHVSPYQVDWRDPSGKWIRGSSLPFTAVNVVEPERRAAMRRSFGVLNTEGMPTSVFSDWPSVLPPFLKDVLTPLPTGHLMIRRTPVVTERVVRYDVIGRRGTLVAVIEMPTNQQIVAVGKRGVYVANTDADGITRLYRHPVPRIE